MINKYYILLIFIIYSIYLYIFCTNKIVRETLYIKPLWGIGNRLRILRKAIELCKHLNRTLVIVEKSDEGFKGNMKKMFGLPFPHIEDSLFKLLYKSHCTKVNFNKQCTYVGTLKELRDIPLNTPIYMNLCDIQLEDIDNNMIDNSSLYQIWNPHISLKSQKILAEIRSKQNVVGVHIRQGNVNDWHRGYFYNDEWRNISKKEPESSPHFCCFEDASKNLSACPSNIQHIEKYIEIMKTYPQNTTFFVCSDRTGCLLYLYQIFPNRVIMIPLAIETKKIDTQRGFDDFICLGACREIITSQVSSFSDEAKQINNNNIKTIEEVT